MLIIISKCRNKKIETADQAQQKLSVLQSRHSKVLNTLSSILSSHEYYQQNIDAVFVELKKIMDDESTAI